MSGETMGERVFCEECLEEWAWTQVSGIGPPAQLRLVNGLPIEGFDLYGAALEEVVRLAEFLDSMERTVTPLDTDRPPASAGRWEAR